MSIKSLDQICGNHSLLNYLHSFGMTHHLNVIYFILHHILDYQLF